ncbi:Hypothetical protein A7982_04176 [Minicystis rosea]|nr:Hypothetical protein A7982_04176 [Minicystis rosea]
MTPLLHDTMPAGEPDALARLRAHWNIDDIETPPAAPGMKPRLTGVCTYESRDGEVARVESARRVTDIEEVEDRRALARILPMCDGIRPLREIAPEIGIPEDRLAAIAATLFELGVIDDAASGPVTGVAFNRHISSIASPYFFVLSQKVGLHARLMNRPPRRLLLGWLIESQHFIASAADYMSVAVSSAPSERARMLLSDYLASEFWHGSWVRQGLFAAGLSAEALNGAEPLPGTSAVTNALRILAARDFHAFAACLCLHESPAIDGTEQATAGFWSAITASGALPATVTDPFREHHMIDCAEQHGSIAEQLFVEKDLVSAGEQRRIKRAVLGHAHTLAAWFRQTLDYYGPAEGPPVFTFDGD